MCEFCNEDPKPILYTKYEIPNAKSDVNDRIPTVGTLIMLDEEQKTISIDFGINKNNFIKEEFAIKFCPMCGREL